jgi:hypothetical protein
LTECRKDNIFLSLMTMNPLPPQAYTKDTLTKAYMWLVHQNDAIKELATTPDILVSLFLKAQRNGDEALETPSIQNFKKELKSLAGMMGELDIKATPVAHAPSQTAPQVVVQQAKQVNIQNNHMSMDLAGQLDAKSRAVIAEVREQLNLSSDLEVIRLLVSLGYHKAKSLYS